MAREGRWPLKVGSSLLAYMQVPPGLSCSGAGWVTEAPGGTTHAQSLISARNTRFLLRATLYPSSWGQSNGADLTSQFPDKGTRGIIF